MKSAEQSWGTIFLTRAITAGLLFIVGASAYLFSSEALAVCIGAGLLWSIIIEWPALELPLLTPFYPVLPAIVIMYTVMHAPTLFILLLGSCTAFDTCAYLVGSAIGRHKLCPTISPGKTIEGTIGGYLGCAAWWYGFSWFNQVSLPWPVIMLFIVLFGTSALWGDLLVSLFKRRVGIKDTGSVLPGHGGLLDRLDSLLFSAYPLIMLYPYLAPVYR